MNIYILIIIILLIIFIFCLPCLYLYYNRNTDTTNNNSLIHGHAKITDPFIEPIILKNFITKNKCNQIIEKCKNELFDSEIIGGINKNIRNSRQCWISKDDPLVFPMFEKISTMYNIPIQNAEHLQVVKYLPGQFFNEHHDACCENNKHCEEFVKKGGQRIITVLIYLSDNFKGGETYFKNLNLKIKLNMGDAIVFFPLANKTSKCHPFSLHAGLPVDDGVKWIANLWFRENKIII